MTKCVTIEKNRKGNKAVQTKTRYYLLDSLRGLWILAMVAYHALWDMVNIYDVPIPWFASDMAFVVQRCIRWGFLLLAGFCLMLAMSHYLG